MGRVKRNFHAYQKTHVNLFFHIHVGGQGKRVRQLYNGGIYQERWEIVIKKVRRKRKVIKQLVVFNEVVRLESEVVNFEFFFGMVHGQPYEGFQKIPHILVLIIHHQNLLLHRVKLDMRRLFYLEDDHIQLRETIIGCMSI